MSAPNLNDYFQTYLNHVSSFAKITQEMKYAMENDSKKKVENGPNLLDCKTINEIQCSVDGSLQQLENFQGTLFPCLAPRISRRDLSTKDRHRKTKEKKRKEDSSYEPSPEPRKANKKQKSKNGDHKNERKEKKKRVARGTYTTVSSSLRPIIFQILYEQAQIWYDLNFNMDVNTELKKERALQFITNKNSPQDLVKIEVKEEDKTDFYEENSLQQIAFPSMSFSNDDKQFTTLENMFPFEPITKPESPVSFQDPDIFVEKYEESELDSFCKIKSEEPSFFASMKYFDELIGRKSMDKQLFTMDSLVNNVLPPALTEERTKLTEKAVNVKKEENVIIEIPIQPLGIPLTIKTTDIMKFLNHNQTKVNEENKKDGSEETVSILSELSRLTEISEKALVRIAIGGPERKKGGGRKRLDSNMEKELTFCIIELNKRGRPPTREEVMRLAQLLTSLTGFIGSKGWLDKYLRRAQEENNQSSEFQMFFKLIPFSERKNVENKKSILTCLKEIGASDETIKGFKKMEMKTSFEGEFEDLEDEVEEYAQPTKRLLLH